MPHIFFSYSSMDSATVHQFANRIKEDCGLSYWIDTENILPGDSLVGKINQGLEVSEVVVLWVTSNALNSAWVKAEWESVLADQISQRTARIVPVVAEPNLILPALLVNIKRLDVYSSELSDVARELSERVKYGYEGGTHNIFFRVNKPFFGTNCKAFWNDRRFRKELERLWTGKVGSNHELDYEYKFEGATGAPAGAIVKIEIQVEGTGTKLWPEAGGAVDENGTWTAICYLRRNTIQKTKIIFTVYPPGTGASPLVKRSFTIVS
jgi:hypothetical protein